MCNIVSLADVPRKNLATKECVYIFLAEGFDSNAYKRRFIVEAYYMPSPEESIETLLDIGRSFVSGNVLAVFKSVYELNQYNIRHVIRHPHLLAKDGWHEVWNKRGITGAYNSILYGAM